MSARFGLGLDPQEALPADPFSSLQEIADQAVRGAEDGKKKPFSIKIGTDGSGAVQGDLGDLLSIAQAAQKYRGVLEGYSNQLAQREQQVRSHPIQNVLTTIAGNLAAQDVKLPGFVRGLGAASLQLNPTADQLAHERIGLAEKLSSLGERDVALSLTQARFQQEQTERRAEEGRRKLTSVLRPYEERVKLGQAPADRASFLSDVTRRGGITRQDADDELQRLSAEAAVSKMRIETERKEKQADRDALVKSGAQARGEQARETEGLRARNRYAQVVASQDHSLGTRKAFADYRETIKKDEALSMVPKKDLHDLASLRDVDRYLDDVESLLKRPEFADKMGYWKVERILPIFAKSPERVRVENLLAHETPRILTLALRGGVGGASIIRTEQGRQMIRQLGVMNSMTLAQAAEVIKNIRAVTRNSRDSIRSETPSAPWDEYRDLLGSNTGVATGSTTEGQSLRKALGF